MRFPQAPLSAHRNCQTSGPRFRPLLMRLPCCIRASRARSCDAKEFLRNATGNKDAWRGRSELLCDSKLLVNLNQAPATTKFSLFIDFCKAATIRIDNRAKRLQIQL